MKIGIDLDEVLANFAQTYLEFHNLKKKTNYKLEQMNSYYFEEVFKEPRDEVVDLIYQMYQSKFNDKITPLKGSIEAVKILKKNNELFIITSRQKHFEKQTKEWVEKYFPKTFKKIILTNFASKVGNEKSKAQICDELGIDIFVDDQPRYCNDCVRENRHVFILNHLWNETEKLHPNIIRVQNWAELLQKIENLQKVY